MTWLENNVHFGKVMLEKDHRLVKFGWNFDIHTSGHPVIPRVL